MAQSAPTSRIRIAFLGVAHSHGMEKVKVVRASPDYRLIGVCEEDPALRQQLIALGVPLLGREALLANSEISAVAVESDVAAHAADGIAVLKARKHLHLEKPPAADYASLATMYDLAAQSVCVIQHGYMWRSHPGFARIFEAVRAGWLGSVYLIKGCMSTLIDADRRPEWARFAGGQMFEQGSHIIDAMVRLLGKPAKVTGFLRKDGAFADSLKDNTAAVLEWDRALGLVQASTLMPSATRYRGFEVYGSKGCAVLSPIEPPTLRIDLPEAAGPYARGPQTVDLPPYRRYEDDFAAFARAIRGEQTLATTPAQDLAVQETILRASGMLEPR
jgi:predicted dehydrogenase